MSIAIVHDEPASFDCERCDGTGIEYFGHDPDWCGECGGTGEDHIDLSPLATLAHNLAIAGGLCAAFELGRQFCWRAMVGLPAAEDWRPGSGRAAP